jgi:hypothetical protein
MRCRTLFTASLTAVALGCGGDGDPTQPSSDATLSQTSPALAAARNTWTPAATPTTVPTLYGHFLGAAPNRNGRTVVYVLGGSDEDGATMFRLQAYNAQNDVWSGRMSQVQVFHSNGAVKLGSKLYYTGGYDHDGGFDVPIPSTIAYDYLQDRITRRARLPIDGAEGVSGAIGGKLYVLPGACSGFNWPKPGACFEEPTRRFFRYDPGSDTWETLPSSMHFHRRGAAAVIGGKLYVVGGVQGDQANQPVTSLEVYDPATRTWRNRAPIPVGGHMFGAALGSTFFVVVSGSPERAYSYDPGTNRWTAKAAPAFFGPVVRVEIDGKARLFTTGEGKAAVYTP